MRVLLVYPRFPQTFWSFDRAVALMGRQVLLPPLGLLTVAALLPRHWPLQLVDCNVRPVEPAEWQAAELVILSAMLVQRRDLARQIALAKAHGCRVAVGGPFVSSSPDAPELAGADYLVLDEGEITVPLLLQALERGQRQGRFSAGGARPDMALSPIPRFELLDQQAYAMLAVQFSRGCPFACEFCDIIVLYGRRPRTKSPAQLIAELEAIHRLGWRGDLFLVDDNFIGNKQQVKQLLPALAAWQERHHFPFAFTTEASLDLAADPELMEGMEASGFQRVFLGIETPDTASLSGAGKHQNTRAPLLQAVQTITARGLLVMGGFILGFDGERAGAGGRIVEFVQASGIPVAMLGILQALPNTALWQRLERDGRLLQLDPALAAERDRQFDDGVQTNLLNFKPTRPMEEIAAEFLAAFDQLYEPGSYLRRIQHHTAQLAHGRRRRRRWPSGNALLRRQARRGLLRLLRSQGLERSSRWLFWRCLLATLVRRPVVLPEFLFLCALQEHFLDYRQVVRQQVSRQLAWSRVHLAPQPPG